MAKKKEPARACVRKGDKPAKKQSARISVIKYIEQLDIAMAETASQIESLNDDHWFLMGVYEGLASVKRNMQEISK